VDHNKLLPARRLWHAGGAARQVAKILDARIFHPWNDLGASVLLRARRRTKAEKNERCQRWGMRHRPKVPSIHPHVSPGEAISNSVIGRISRPYTHI
jgi:hypothetical protein